MTDAFDQASRAGWWWPFPDFAVVSERPVEVHGEWVGTFDDPVAAAAWQYDCPVDLYRQLRRRT